MVAESKCTRNIRWKAEAKKFYNDHHCDAFFMLGLGLYWGEGKKTEKPSLCNSDPRLVLVWKKWCDKYIPNVKFRGVVMLHETEDVIVSSKFWSDMLGVGLTDIKCYTLKNRRTTNTRPLRKMQHGVFHLYVRKGSLEWLTKMLVWFEIMDGDQ